MPFFARLDGSTVVGVYEEDSPVDGTIELVGWAGWPTAPSKRHKLHWVNGALEWVDPRPLAQAKGDKRDEIRAERDARLALPKTTAIGVLDSTPADLANLVTATEACRLKVAAGRTGTAAKTRYTLSDDTRPRFSVAELEGALLEVFDAIEAIHDQEKTLRDAIKVCLTVAEVEAIQWPST